MNLIRIKRCLAVQAARHIILAFNFFVFLFTVVWVTAIYS